METGLILCDVSRDMVTKAQKKKYKQYEEKGKKYTDAILNSPSTKKIVAAGPGTGKTYLFEEMCKKEGNDKNLVLTFINELVNDLKRDLSRFADVRTLHSFAVKMLQSDFYMKLTEIIEEDFNIIQGKAFPYKEVFSHLKESYIKELEFYSNRRKYYNYFGPYCSIYSLIKVFETNEAKIPQYNQILVDEVQDFNKLEIAVIDLLAKKNPVLLVGDDDQSLYSFKGALPEKFRAMCKLKEYAKFDLPFCRRCPKVIVDAATSIFIEAKKNGFFKNRINKRFEYFYSEEKDKISSAHPKIRVEKLVYEQMLAYKIEGELKLISKIDKNFSVLIICPLPQQIERLEQALYRNGFKSIQVPNKKERDIVKKEGYKILLKNEMANLGWRILAKFFLSEQQLKKAVKESFGKQTNLKEFFKKEDQEYILSILKSLHKIQKSQPLSVKEIEQLFRELGYDPFVTTIERIKEDLNLDKNIVSSQIHKNVPIRIATPLGSKGLTSDYVFLVSCDDRFILSKGGKKMTDENIRQFLVCITRPKKKLYIYSGASNPPAFLKWIDQNLYELS